MATSDDIGAGFARLVDEINLLRTEIAALNYGVVFVNDVEDIPPGTPADTLVVVRG